MESKKLNSILNLDKCDIFIYKSDIFIYKCDIFIFKCDIIIYSRFFIVLIFILIKNL